jgi:hypothetical protein
MQAIAMLNYVKTFTGTANYRLLLCLATEKK